jgi:acetyl-CoA acetyltransferase
MSHTFTARNDVAIVGYAQSDLVRHADVPIGALTVRTCLDAITDAGLEPHQVDGFTTGAIRPAGGGQGSVDGIDIVTANWLAEKLGIRPRWSSGFQGYGQLPGSVVLATMAIATGSADYVLVHRALSNPAGKYHVNPMTEAEGAMQWTAPQGFWGPPAGISLSCNEYMQRYGHSREDLAEVVVGLREAGSELPWSYWYQQPLDTHDYLDARIIADPISIFDCDIPIDGAAAFILTSAERAADLPHAPVYISGYAQGNPIKPTLGMDWLLDDIMAGGRQCIDNLWAHTGLTLADIDHPQLYDGFSPFIWYWLEALGYCEPGQAPEFLRSDDAAHLRPLHSGGSLGNGRMHGVPQMLDCYLQLSGRAGDRQLDDRRIGLACHSSPHYGGLVVYSAERF